MNRFEALDLAQQEFAARLAEVSPDQWDAPSVCTDWSVRDLVNHVVAGCQMSALIARGGSRENAIALFQGSALGADPLQQFTAAANDQAAALRAPGALEATVQHPIGDVTGMQLLGFRIGDLTLHSWDLARSIGADETLNPALVEAVYEELKPMEPIIGSIGVFGDGPSGTLDESAALQDRVLDLSGRRP
ncbi:MAG: TIGR03086 family metal-binding protein [Acidimicrobiia bacterium]